MKSQLQRSSYGELSSIRSYPTEKLNTQSDSELVEVDMEKLNFNSYYIVSDPIQSQSNQVEGELFIREFIKKLIATVSKKITENEQIKMLPIIGYQSSIDRMSHPIQQYFRQHEDPTYDYLTGGLEEDEEPVRFQQEQWLVQKVNSIPAKILEVEQQSTNSNRQSLTAQTFMRSRVLIQDQAQAQLNNQKNLREKDKLPGIVDLNDPLDISITEELLRAQKERDYKIKQDLKEQERRRKQKELEEQQLKYELISKDKKSKSYTYDYDGKLISVTTLKGHKFPPTAATLGSKFEDGQTKISMFNKRKTFFQSSSSQIKKRQEDDKDKDQKDQVKFQSIAPLVNENMHLQQGVLIIQEGRVREGPKDQAINLDKMNDPALRMIRNEYLSLTQQINASHNQSSTQLVKAEEAQVKEFSNDKDKKQILNRIRRLSQPSITSDGNIKINSMQMYEQVAQVIFEDKEQHPIPIIKPNNNNITKDLQMMKSPTDQYNISLYKNTAWSKEVPSIQGNTTKLKGNKAKVKDILSTVGIVVKRTRERRGNSETIHLPKMKNISQI